MSSPIESSSRSGKPPGNTTSHPEGLKPFASVQAPQQSQTAVEPRKGPGRPSSITPQLFAQICDELAEGLTLNQICRAADMPASSTVRRFIQKASKEIRDNYAQARAIGIESLADDLVEIADDTSGDTEEIETANGTITRANREFIERSKVRIDTRKFMLAKLCAHIYGDKVETNVTIDHQFTLKVGNAQTRERMQKQAEPVRMEASDEVEPPKFAFVSKPPSAKSAQEIIGDTL